jgi:hypothetical protein
MSHQLSEEQLSKLKEAIRNQIREFTGTANVAGYDTPFAFSSKNGKEKDQKRIAKATGDGYEYTKSITENRWLELKRDETRTPQQKVSYGIREIKNQLAEIEKFIGWYNRLRNENNLNKQDFFKRTENNIFRIKERLVRIANTIQEIDKVEEGNEIIEDQGVQPKKPMAIDKYVVTATPKGATKDAERRAISKPAPKNSAETQAASLRKMDKYQTVRLKKVGNKND